ncbi:MAG: hypothetical protein L0215_20420 [Gemmataceae bacterium]|nr:hypothetical protein [Gemmataceae bacterium]
MLLLLLVFFLFPLALYCWIVGAINRRGRPTLAVGFWDCLGMLFAASGFLLLVGPILLKTVFEQGLGTVVLQENPSDAFFDWWCQRWLFWAIYYVVLLGGAALLLWWRGRKTVIYNVDLEAFAPLFFRAIQEAGLCAHAKEDIIQLFADSVAPREATGANGPLAEVSVEYFVPLCHVTLHWRRNDLTLRTQVENKLNRLLPEARTLENPAGGWLYIVTAILFGLIFLAGMLWVFLTFFPPRRW